MACTTCSLVSRMSRKKEEDDRERKKTMKRRRRRILALALDWMAVIIFID